MVYFYTPKISDKSPIKNVYKKYNISGKIRRHIKIPTGLILSIIFVPLIASLAV